MITAVFDTNVLASGFVNKAGTPGQLILLWTYGTFELVVSEHILSELEATFETPCFRKRLTPSQRAANLALLRREATTTSITEKVSGVATHPEDDLVLAAAVSHPANYLITGDTQLQKLCAYEGVTILSPRAFLDLLTLRVENDERQAGAR